MISSSSAFDLRTLLSISSSTLKLDVIPFSPILSRIRSKQKELIVDIFAFWSKICCLRRCLSLGCSFINALILFSSLFFSSAAASFVKVTTTILSALTPEFLSAISCTSLSVRTAVLPLPAAADTISDVFLASIASCCCPVHATLNPPFRCIFCQVYSVLPQYRLRQALCILSFRNYHIY